jgi:hypothetical protein
LNFSAVTNLSNLVGIILEQIGKIYTTPLNLLLFWQVKTADEAGTP